MREYHLNQKLTKQILDSSYSQLFETIIEKSDVSPTTVAVLLTETLKALERDGIEVDRVTEEEIREMFSKMSKGELTKEALPEIIIWLSKNEDRNIEDAIESLGLKILSEKELQKFIENVMEDNKNLIEEQGEESFGVLMGIIMKKLRGKADPTLTTKILKDELRKL